MGFPTLRNRELPKYLTDNVSSKCFVYRHPNLFHWKSVVFSYAHNRDKEVIRAKAIKYAIRMNTVLGPPPPKSTEGRMSSRNRSHIVRVYPKRSLAARNGLYYYSWATRWKGCPRSGGVSWPYLTWGDSGAYVLAALTLEMRTVERFRVIEEFEKIKRTAKYKKILRLKPKISIEKFWPN